MVWTWLGQALLSVKHNIIIGFSSTNGSFQSILFVTSSIWVRSSTTCFWVHLIWLHIWNGLRLTYSSGLQWVCYVVEGSLGWCTAGILITLQRTSCVASDAGWWWAPTSIWTVFRLSSTMQPASDVHIVHCRSPPGPNVLRARCSSSCMFYVLCAPVICDHIKCCTLSVFLSVRKSAAAKCKIIFAHIFVKSGQIHIKPTQKWSSARFTHIVEYISPAKTLTPIKTSAPSRGKSSETTPILAIVQ